MTREEFEQLVAEEFEAAIPAQFRPHIKNVAFLVEDEPSAELRKKEGLQAGETLLGYYNGVPYPMRGDWYGLGATVPDTITLFQNPIEDEAAHAGRFDSAHHGTMPHVANVRRVIRDTIWHEVAHLFGMDEEAVRRRERARDNL